MGLDMGLGFLKDVDVWVLLLIFLKFVLSVPLL